MQRVGLEKMAKGLIKRLAVFKKIAQRKMTIDGVAIGQARVANELFAVREADEQGRWRPGAPVVVEDSDPVVVDARIESVVGPPKPSGQFHRPRGLE